MTRVARVMLPCLLALLLGALSLSPPTRAETQPASDKTYDAPPHLRDTGRLLRDLFKQERYADIHAICERGYAQATDDEARAFFLHKGADAYVAQGDSRGLDLLYQVLQRFPATMQAPLVVLDLGDLYLEQAQAAQEGEARRALALQAMEALDRFVAAYPTHERIVRALWKRGACHDLLGDYEAMLAEYEAAVNLYPVSPWTHACLQRLIQLQHYLERWDDSILSARRYLELFSDKHPETAHFLLGISFARKGLTAQAAVEFERALAYYAGDEAEAAETLYRIAAEWLAVQEYEYAHAYLAAILTNPAPAFDTWRGHAQYLDAQTYKLQGDLGAALAGFRALAGSPEGDSYRATAHARIAETEAALAGR